MKKSMLILLAILLATSGFMLSCNEFEGFDGEEFLGASRAAENFTANKTGSKGGWDYEYWKDSGGSGTMTVNDNGTFSGNWSGVNNILMRVGKKFGSTQSHNQIGNISITYSASFTPGNNSYLCVYGWSKDPLVEYYIIESYGSYKPGGSSQKGTWNGYELYETTRTNQPSIEGTKTFKQFWAIRSSKRTSGTIDVTGIFNAWYDKGMSLGKMYEVALCLESWQSTGSGNISSYSLKYGNSTLGGGSSGSTSSNTTTTTNNNTSSSSSSSSSSGNCPGCGKSGSWKWGGNTTSHWADNCACTWNEAHSYSNGTCKCGRTNGSTTTTTTTNTNTNTSTTTSTSSSTVTVQAESMTKAGKYTGNISSPFQGVALYANDDKISTSQNLASGSRTITVRGASNNSSSAQIKVMVGGSQVGTISFSGTSAASKTITFNNSSAGSKTIELVCINDNNTWDVFIDYIEIK